MAQYPDSATALLPEFRAETVFDHILKKSGFKLTGLDYHESYTSSITFVDQETNEIYELQAGSNTIQSQVERTRVIDNYEGSGESKTEYNIIWNWLGSHSLYEALTVFLYDLHEGHINA